LVFVESQESGLHFIRVTSQKGEVVKKGGEAVD
jgi:hypothetical protein